MTEPREADAPDWLAYPRSLVSPIYGHLGFDITAGGEGWLEITLRVTDIVLNADGVVHGGVWLVIADSAMGGALRTLLVPGERAVTGQIDFRWLRPFEGDTLRAVGRVSRRGRLLNHCTVELIDEHDRIVGTGSSTFVVVRGESS
ncbi:MAG: PaaI family thioesterase [Dehalococcoidia bacterium]|nr:PaaI family thioesterase [Dehalococcoidia bacterium]